MEEEEEVVDVKGDVKEEGFAWHPSPPQADDDDDDQEEEEERYSDQEGEEEEEDDEDAYERERQRNIAANQAKLLELGLLNSSHVLFGEAAAARRRQWDAGSAGRAPVSARGPAARRRSSRLQGQEAKHYGEELPRHERSSPSSAPRSAAARNTRRSWQTAGYRQEVYDKEHLLLLGTCETPYPRMFEKKIYDQARGTTCHQCRQKTIDKKTTCSKCQAIPGQFCGTCLQVRYGENVQETWNNPSWVCPVCRDICNCSFCRPAKGWAPTGVLAHKARKAGYPSVAHYLITTYQREEELNEGQPPSVNAADIKMEGEHSEGEEDQEEGGNVQSAANLEAKRNDGSETRKRKRDEILLLGGNGAGVTSPPRRRLQPHASTTATTTTAQAPQQQQHNVIKTESSLPEPYVDLQQLTKDRIVACWADPSSGDTYWLARVLRGPTRAKTKRKVKEEKERQTLVRIRWFEELERKKNHFREGQEDNLAVETIFHIIPDENFVKAGSGRWRLEEDLSVYDL